MLVKIGNITAPLSARAETEGSIVLTLANQSDLKALVDAMEENGKLEVYSDDNLEQMTGYYAFQRLTRATIWPGTGEAELEFVTADIPQLEADELKAKNDMLEACILEMSELLYA